MTPDEPTDPNLPEDDPVGFVRPLPTERIGDDEAETVVGPGDETVASGLHAGEGVSPGAGEAAHAPRYEIVRLIGEGGMGSVYEAKQAKPARRVALKMIRSGYASKAVLRRFEVEADLLGKLKHPGIAAIYEAGFSQGRPFFAMEFIDGPTLTEYADMHKLGTRDRLALFGQVCDAIHHAHTKGVVHRDLKPANILVAQVGDPPKPQVKVLDFGVARVTESDVQATTMHTDVGQIVGTLPYMSPEQVAGENEDIDTRSDVYALGVVLYELLSGQLPYDLRQRVIHEAARVICEEAPTRLSGIDTKLRGDIETIVGKALEKDRERRYASANDLSADVRRYLEDEPISARPPSRGYLMKKFAQRNTALVVGVAATFAVLVLGIIGTTVFAVQAEDARARAERARVAESEQRQHATEMGELAQQRAEEADRARRAAESDAYHANLAAAQSALAGYNPDAARGYLEACAPGLRNWEWAHCYAGLDGSLMVLEAGEGEVSEVCYSPDGSRIVTGTRMGEVRVWDAQTGRVRAVLKRDRAGVTAIAFSADGSRFVTGSHGGTVILWETETGAELARFEHEGQYSSISFTEFSPDGSRLLVATMTQRVFLWDTNTHEKLGEYLASDDPTRQFAMERGAFDARFTADGESFYVVPDRWATTSVSATSIQPVPQGLSDGRAGSRIKVYDAATGALRGEVICGLEGVSGDARDWLDGERLVLGLSVGRNYFLDGAARDEMTELGVGLTGRLDVARVDAAGRRAVLVSAGAVYLHDFRTGERIAELAGGRHGVTHLALSPDGSLVGVTVRDNTARLWDAEDGSAVTVLQGHAGVVVSIDFSPDGRYCVTGAADGTARVWRTRSHAMSAEVDRPMLIRGFMRSDAVAYRPDSAAFAFLGEGSVFICDASTGGVLEEHAVEGWQTGTELMVDLHYGGETLSIITSAMAPDPETGMLQFKLNLRDLFRGKTYSRSAPILFPYCRVSGDGAYVLSADRVGEVMLLHVADLATGEAVTFDAPPGGSWSHATLAPDSGSFAAVVGGRVRVWDMAGEVIFEAPPAPEGTAPADQVAMVMLSPDGEHLVAGTARGERWVWDLGTGQRLRTLEDSATTGMPMGLLVSAFSPDGDRLAVLGADFKVHLWDITTGEHLATLDDHTGMVKSISFSPDGSRIVTASDDGTVRLWDAGTGQNVLLLHRSEGPQLGARFSPDGQSIVSGSADGTVRVWHTRPCRERFEVTP